jgi:mannose-6-phosphate isomerase-like protein (cupin superfamily)
MLDEEVTMSRRARHVKSMVLPFDDNIKKVARKNLAFRKAIYTGAFSELAAMSIPPMGELGEEAHEYADEILFLVEGKGEVILDGRTEPACRHDAIFVTAGQLHNLRNTGRGDLKLVAVYSPPPSDENTAVHRAGAKGVEERMQHAWEQ